MKHRGGREEYWMRQESGRGGGEGGVLDEASGREGRVLDEAGEWERWWGGRGTG